MAKQTGLGDYVAVDDSGGTARDISNDVGDYGINIAQELVETTGLDKSARERITGMSDGDVSLNGSLTRRRTRATTFSRRAPGLGRSTCEWAGTPQAIRSWRWRCR